MKRKRSKSLKFLLVVAMLVSMFSTTAMAAEGSGEQKATGEAVAVRMEETVAPNAKVYPVTGVSIGIPYKEGNQWRVLVTIYGNPDSVNAELDLRRVTNFTANVSGTTHYLNYNLGVLEKGSHTFKVIVISDYTAQIFQPSRTFYVD